MRVYHHFVFATSALIILPAMALAAGSATPAAPVAPPKSELTVLLDKASTSAFPELAPDSFGYALTHGTPWINERYRYENVDQSGIAKDANASTLRSKFGYKTGLWQGFQFGAEGENTTALGSDRYNSTTNGKAQYPVVSDPEDTLLNQLYLSYQGLEKTNITLGRQLINLDNQRFVGAVDWRQNDQTFDALTVSSQIVDRTSFYFAHVNKVNRITGPDASNGAYDSNSNLLNFSYEFDPAIKATLYSYMLDFEDAPTLSSATTGLRLTGTYPVSEEVSFIYAGEAARQTDNAENTAEFNEDYYLLEPGITVAGWTGKFGYEVLGGDGTASHAFQAPLGTLHAFNGWADKFLTTPANGLEDAYVSLGYKLPFEEPLLKGADIALAYHDFQANEGSADYGTEWNASIQQTFFDHYTAGIKFADYEADTLFTDTQKVILTLQMKY